MKETLLTVSIKQPGKAATLAIIPNELQALQDIVQGHIDIIRIDSERIAIINEEGRLNGMEYNCDVVVGGYLTPIYGPIIMCGVNGEGLASLPEEQEKKTPSTAW